MFAVDKYGCASRKNLYLFVVYICLGLLHVVASGTNCSNINAGCKVLAESPTLLRTVGKLGFGSYLSIPACIGLLAFGLYTFVCVTTLYEKVLVEGTIADGLLYVLLRKTISSGLLAAAAFFFTCCLVTLYSLCESVQVVAVVRWHAQPKKEHNFLIEAFWLVCRNLLGSVCLDAVLSIFVAPIKLLLEIASSLL